MCSEPTPFAAGHLFNAIICNMCVCGSAGEGLSRVKHSERDYLSGPSIYCGLVGCVQLLQINGDPSGNAVT